jgi:hypothetical protein
MSNEKTEWNSHEITKQLSGLIADHIAVLEKELIDYARVEQAGSVEAVGVNTISIVSKVEAFRVIEDFIGDLDAD